MEQSIRKDETVAILGGHRLEPYRGTMEEIKKRKLIRFLTTHGSFNYFVHSGAQKGYEYEMAKEFVNYLNVKAGLNKGKGLIRIEMIPVKRDELLKLLKEGYGDIAAAGLTITDSRKEEVSFSIPYHSVSEVVILHKRLENLGSVEQLSGLTGAVRKSSSYYESLLSVNRYLEGSGKKPLVIAEAPEELETETLMELVSLGRYDFTVADSHIAEAGAAVFDGLAVKAEMKIRDGGQIAWALPKGTSALLGEVNAFLPRYGKGSLKGNLNLKKYFQGIGRIGVQMEGRGKKIISRYDSLIKKHARTYGWDWRLLSALAYQESRFNQKRRSAQGAVGIFQIKKKTAREKYVGVPEIEGEQNVENNILAGTKYLSWLKETYFSGEDIEEEDRIRLTLAAYNAGPGRLRQAREQAKKMGLDPDRWFGNVEHAFLAMGKSQPVSYVAEINSRFLAYALFGF